MTDELPKIEIHVRDCAVCSKANRRVNDFCETGTALFIEWASTRKPVNAAMVTITDEQFDRLVQQHKRRHRQSERN